MFEKSEITLREKNLFVEIPILRITAIWAFSESAFGGILHALKIPFRGLIISSSAVIFICFIALHRKKKWETLNATFLVILIKFVVSPHSPLTAHMAVLLQGLLGTLLFSKIKYYKISSFVFGIVVLLLSGIQKIIILTIVFGNTLWESINIFIQYLSNELFNLKDTSFDFSFLFITIYLAIHLIVGLFIGLYAARLPEKIKNNKIITSELIDSQSVDITENKIRRRKNWFMRPTGIIILVISISVIIISYLSPDYGNETSINILIMLLRSIIITLIWLLIIVPLVKKLFIKLTSKSRSEFSDQMGEIVLMFPHFKKVISHFWKASSKKKGFSRVQQFFSNSFYYLLLSKSQF